MAHSTLGDDASQGSLGTLARLLIRWRRRQALPLEPPLPPGVPEPVAPPPPDSLPVLQWLWGPGHVIPGGDDYVLTLTRPLGLTAATMLLDVSAGLGGPLRALLAAYSLHAAGLERDLELARRGMAMMAEAGQARRTPISVYDPESFDLKSSQYDGVLAREIVYAVRGKERFLRVLRQGLKPQGQLVLTDFMVDRGRGDAGALGPWEAVQPYTPLLWTLERMLDCLKSLGFEVQATEDITPSYRAMIVAAWSGLLGRAELATLPRTHFRPILDEAERSLLTLKALDGALRMYRLHAIARPA